MEATNNLRHIKVTDAVATIILESSNKRLMEISQELKRLTDEERSLKDIVSQLSMIKSEVSTITGLSTNPNRDGYRPGWTWIKKVQFIIQKKGPSTTTEIVEALIKEYEPEIPKVRGTVVASVSAILSAKSKGKNILFTKTQNDAGENVYDIVIK